MSPKPSGHATERPAAHYDLLRVLADFQQGRGAGSPYGSEFDTVLIDGHAGTGLRHPVPQTFRDAMTHGRPLLFGIRFRTHIPRMRPAIYRIDPLAGEDASCSAQRNAAKDSSEPSTPTTMSR